MSTTIRLSRVGSTHDPRYRIVVQPTRSKRDGKALEVLGTYHPLRQEDKQIVFNADRFNHWVSQGAMVSKTVSSIARKAVK